MMWAKLKQHIWEWRGVFWIAPTIAGIAIALRLMGWLQPWEWAALDQYFRWRPPEPSDDRIVIVGISEADLKQVGQWPIPDTVLAQLLEKIKAQKPMAIGLDLYRDLLVKPSRSLSLTDVLENRIPADLMRDASTGAFAGRIVLIGSTATSLNDYFYTPYSGDQITTLTRTPGVEVHANLISQILSAAVEGRPTIKSWPEVVEGLWIFLWSSVGATLCWALRNASRRFTEDVAKLLPRWTVISLFLTGVSLVGGSYLAFLVDGWWIPVVPPVLALLGSATAMTGYIANVEREDRRTVMNRILINQGTYQYVQDKFSTQQIGCVRLKGREQGTLVYQVLRSPTLKENPEGSISVSVAIALAKQRSLYYKRVSERILSPLLTILSPKLSCELEPS